MAFELIEASAGTGKTYCITTRYLSLLLESGLAVNQILVVTFTEAATAELRDRIRVRIREVRDLIESDRLAMLEDPDLRDTLERLTRGPGAAERAVKRLTNAIISFDEAAIFTIHGFCTRVLREQAFSTGMDFSAEVMTDDLPVLETVVADFARSQLDSLTAEEFGWCVEHSVFFGGATENDWRVTGRLLTSKELKALHELIADPLLEIIPADPGLASARARKDPEAVALAMTHALITYAREGLARQKNQMRVLSFGDMLVRVHQALEGPGGGQLAANLRAAYRAALIDEFQDTDPLQYDIIRMIYEGTASPVVFVGDPKQAIYSFRGGDIYTYFRATAAIPETQQTTLSVNYRSAKDLVASVAKVFTATERRTPFADEGKTVFPEVTAHHEKGKEPRVIHDAAPRGALHWLLLPGPDGTGKAGGFTWTKGNAEPVVIAAVVREIGGLIARSKEVQGGLRPSDIAVLVRSNAQARFVQANLLKAGIPCIVKTLSSVYASVAAGEWLALLRAVAHPGNDADVSAALLTPSLGYTARDVAALKQDAAAYGRLAERLIALRMLWEGSQNGFMRMSSALLHEPGLALDGAAVASRLLIYADAERRLTDLLHLTELLHQESILRPGHDHLVHWLEERIAESDDENEEASIRLESDAARVQIVTVHMSKGLEYPVVFCPYTFEGKSYKLTNENVIRYHELRKRKAPASEEFVHRADIGSAERKEHFDKRVREDRSESIRHLYVALTRARQRCYVVWGHVNNMEDAALSYLLFTEDKRERKALAAAGHDAVVAPVLRLVAASKGAMASSVIDPGKDVPGPAPVLTPVQAELEPRTFARGHVRPSWMYASYTSLTSEWVRSGRDTDAVVIAPAVQAEGRSIMAFPAGARTGKAWHAFFEHLPFDAGDKAVQTAVDRMLERHGFNAEFSPAMCSMVRTVLETPLGPDGIRLASVPADACARELDFVFACGRFRTAELRVFMADHREAFPEACVAAAATLRERDMQGFMVGTIDLLLESGGRYYIIDYKSNRLGDTVAHYAAAALGNAIAHEHYYLQYLIYTVAVHRYLRTRVPGYAYETHMGGVMYLFLRGMRTGTQDGVFFTRPPLALIADLEARLFHTGGA
jgi:exodeoxyribonuclease V beta subunit